MTEGHHGRYQQITLKVAPVGDPKDCHGITSSPPDGEENFNREFSSGELRIEVHLSTIYIKELRILFGTT